MYSVIPAGTNWHADFEEWVQPFLTLPRFHFLMKTLPKVKTEMSLHVLAYNMKWMMKILGTLGLVEAFSRSAEWPCSGAQKKYELHRLIQPESFAFAHGLGRLYLFVP